MLSWQQLQNFDHIFYLSVIGFTLFYCVFSCLQPVTACLLSAAFFGALGSSFIYGYNLSVVNAPASVSHETNVKVPLIKGISTLLVISISVLSVREIVLKHHWLTAWAWMSSGEMHRVEIHRGLVLQNSSQWRTPTMYGLPISKVRLKIIIKRDSNRQPEKQQYEHDLMSCVIISLPM